jgi:hypothetical protein
MDEIEERIAIEQGHVLSEAEEEFAVERGYVLEFDSPELFREMAIKRAIAGDRDLLISYLRGDGDKTLEMRGLIAKILDGKVPVPDHKVEKLDTRMRELTMAALVVEHEAQGMLTKEAVDRVRERFGYKSGEIVHKAMKKHRAMVEEARRDRGLDPRPTRRRRIT